MRVAALAGGVGGAKLAAGLYDALAAYELSVIVNTADDFDVYGLRVCPDLDTVMYTLAGMANRETGWGVHGDTWRVLEMLASYGEDTWFRVGDRDFGTHILRSCMLRLGRRPTDIARELASALGVTAHLLPMSDDVVATVVATASGDLEFQEYFVRLRQAPEVTGVRFRGIESATPSPEVLSALGSAEAVILCPSNPLVSIGPILALSGLREALTASGAASIAVSPIVRGRALKGPADRMLASLGHESSALGVARMYAGLVQGMVIDSQDVELAPAIRDLGMAVLVTDTVMNEPDDRLRLASTLLDWVRADLVTVKPQ